MDPEDEEDKEQGQDEEEVSSAGEAVTMKNVPPPGSPELPLVIQDVPPSSGKMPSPRPARAANPPPPSPYRNRLTSRQPFSDHDLRPIPGVQNIQVYRSSKAATNLFDPDQPPQKGWTYHHHHDLACWRGLLYAAWAATPADEDIPPYRVMYSTSSDGYRWSTPAHLFPPGTAWATRFYFYRASNGVMLAMACAGMSAEALVAGYVKEDIKQSLLVRRIGEDHSLGPVHSLIKPLSGGPPPFEQSGDRKFVAAGREAAGHSPLLEQQDYGRYAGEKAMKWHRAEAWPDGVLPAFGMWKFGKAFSFYHRADGMLVGLCKMGWVTLSGDEGKTWSLPVRPPTLVTGSAKIWGQRTPDGRYALVYNPHPGERFPLAMTSGEDGVTFRGMGIVHGEVPPVRYAGHHKDVGPQYIRGVAEWAGDAGTIDRSAFWVVYSMSKEDIWVSRIPLPTYLAATGPVRDDFQSSPLQLPPEGWHTYSPAWSKVEVAAEADGNRFLLLANSEPYDYARAIRIFPESSSGQLSFRLRAGQADRGRLEIDLLAAGGGRPVRLALDDKGQLNALKADGSAELMAYQAGEWMDIALRFGDGRLSLTVSGKPLLKDASLAHPCSVYGVSFATGRVENQPSQDAVQDLPDADILVPLVAYAVDDVTVS